MVLWTAELDTLWLEELVAQTQLLGKRARSGYKKEAWVAALKKINKDRFPPFKMSQLKSRHDAIKGMYGVISSIINTSGMGWEASTCRVLCTDSTWDHFLAGKPPSYRVWKDRPFPQYDLCQQLFDGTLATGRYASASVSPCNISDNSSDIDLDYSVHTIEETCEVQQDEDHDAEETSSQRNRTQRTRSPQGNPPSKRRVRSSAASRMTEQFKAQNSIAARELELLTQVLSRSEPPSSKRSSALQVLQDEYKNLLSLDDMVTAVEILESTECANTFLSLSGDLREAWLRRMISRMSN